MIEKTSFPDDIFEKLLQVMEKDKLSYVYFISMFPPVSGKDLQPYWDKALAFCDELGIEEDSKLKMDVEYAKINFYKAKILQHPDLEFQKDLEDLIEKVSHFENDYKNMILMKLYSMQLDTEDESKNCEASVDIANKYLELVDKPYDDLEMTSSVHRYKVLAYFFSKQKPEWIKAYDEYLSWVEKKQSQTLNHYSALQWCFNQLKSIDNPQDKLYYDSYNSVTKRMFGEKSEQFIEILFLISSSLKDWGQFEEAYKVALSIYESAKEVFGSEEHRTIITVLCFMAFLKCHLKEYEDAKNILKRAESIAEECPSNAEIQEGYKSAEKILFPLISKKIEEQEKTQKVSRVKILGGIVLLGTALIWASYIWKAKK